jgi:hypothetical protein
MHPTEWPDWLRRAIRTFLQVFCTGMLASVSLVAAGTWPGLEWWIAAARGALYSAGMALAVSVLTAGQNVLEDKNVIPSMLKAPASPGPAPLGTPAHELVERHVPEPPRG